MSTRRPKLTAEERAIVRQQTITQRRVMNAAIDSLHRPENAEQLRKLERLMYLLCPLPDSSYDTPQSWYIQA